MILPLWHWTNQPNAEVIKEKCKKNLRHDIWTGKHRDAETLRKLNEGKDKWIKENPEEYKESRFKGTRHMLGEGNPNWKGGISESFKTNNRINNKNWFEVRERVLKRLKVCQICGTDKQLIVHHIIEWIVCHEDEEKNLTVLCRSCHLKEHYKLNKKKL